MSNSEVGPSSHEIKKAFTVRAMKAIAKISKRDIFSVNELVSEIELGLIEESMKATAGNKSKASKLIGIQRTTLVEKIRKRQMLGRKDWG
jgi:DNA-binding protein Fis